MSSHTRASAGASEDQYLMDTDSEPGAASATASTCSENDAGLATLLQDSASWLPQVRALKETDVIVLLTPVIKPASSASTDVSDPFEPLGRSLAKRHARIRHVPYISRNGLTSTHLAFIQRGHVIILCLAAQPSERTPFELADVLFEAHDHKPCIIIICSSTPEEAQRIRHLQHIPFPTIILTKGHSPAALEAATSLIYNSPSPKLAHLLRTTPPPPHPAQTRQQPQPQPKPQPPHQLTYRRTEQTTWDITPFDPTNDIPSIHSLWTTSLPPQFSLPATTISSLLHRPGYAKHYTVRSPSSSSSSPSSSSSTILGFCATYLTYADRAGEDLVASLAILLVRRDARRQGIGRALHDHALRELGRTRGVARFQLGSAFPRLLAGPVASAEAEQEEEAEEWFGRRGWKMRNPTIPGQGALVRDMVLDIGAWKTPVPVWGGGGVVRRFRRAGNEDMAEVLEVVDSTAKRMGKMGWFDQYAALMNGSNVKDVIIGVREGEGEGEERNKETIVAAALTYTPSCGSQVAANLPWAARIGDDVGGVTCICIADPKDERHILPPLLDACVQTLHSSGVSRVFVDSVSSGGVEESLRKFGFKEWATYKDVWRET